MFSVADQSRLYVKSPIHTTSVIFIVVMEHGITFLEKLERKPNM